MSLISTYFVDI